MTKTECCGNTVCDDYDQYVMFSYAHNSCNRNHDRYTLCAAHHNEGHEGGWKECKECLGMCPTEMYVWYGTNEYNFEVLKNPPSFEPTLCAGCKEVIPLADGGYVISKGDYFCEDCSRIDVPPPIQ
ncbi:MAG: hypothetical protein J5I65_08690 [Aridibacter famidurans]|nr:hypothetical protein [Aridibacter famidurans]